MRLIFITLLCSVFHCNIDGFLGTLPVSKSNITSSKSTTKKSRKSVSFYDNTSVGTVLDELDGVKVFFNGPISNVNGRNVTSDGYNLGLKYQCVEFVKRYYYEYYNHRMPDSYGHAKDLFDTNLKGHGYNRKRGLHQHPNGGIMKPLKGDLIVYGPSPENPYGHVGIVSKVGTDFVELVQQNVAKNTRATYRLQSYSGHYNIDDSHIVGWLRKQ